MVIVTAAVSAVAVATATAIVKEDGDGEQSKWDRGCRGAASRWAMEGKHMRRGGVPGWGRGGGTERAGNTKKMRVSGFVIDGAMRVVVCISKSWESKCGKRKGHAGCRDVGDGKGN